MTRKLTLGLVLSLGSLLLAGCSKSPPPTAPTAAALPPAPPPPPPPVLTPAAPLVPPPAVAPASPAPPDTPVPASETPPAPAASAPPAAAPRAPQARSGRTKSKSGNGASEGQPLGPGALEALAGRAKHPLANAQVGDWADFRASMPDLGLGGLARAQGDIEMRMKVASRTDTTVTLSREGTAPGGRPLRTGGDITYDLTQPWDPTKAALMREPGEENQVKLVGRTAETVRISDFVMPTEKFQYQITAGGGDLKIESEVSAWFAAEAPLTGMVAMEMDLLGFKVKMQLTSWGPFHEGTLREVPGAKLTKFDHSRVTFAVGQQSFEMMWLGFGQGPSVIDQAGQEHFGSNAIRYLAPGNVFRVRTGLNSNAEMLGSLVLEQGGPASLAQLVAHLPRDNRNFEFSPPIQPAVWERTLARAKVGDWVVWKEYENGRSKYREVTGVSPNEVTGWEVYNLEKSFSHALRYKLDEPKPPKAKNTAAATPPATKKTTTKSTSKKPSTTKKPSTSKKPAPTKKPDDDDPPEPKPEAAEPPPPQPVVVGTETVTVMGRPLTCEVVEVPHDSGRGVALKLWISAEVPLDGVVRREEKGKLVYLLEEFGRAK